MYESHAIHFCIEQCRKHSCFWEYRCYTRVVHPCSYTSIRRNWQFADRSWLVDLGYTCSLFHVKCCFRWLFAKNKTKWESARITVCTFEHAYVPWRDNAIRIAWHSIVICRLHCLKSERPRNSLIISLTSLVRFRYCSTFLHATILWGSFARQTTYSMYHQPQHEYCLSIWHVFSKVYTLPICRVIFIFLCCVSQNSLDFHVKTAPCADFTRCVKRKMWRTKNQKLCDTWNCVLLDKCIASLTIRAVPRMLFNKESLSYTLSTRFEPLYTNMYHVGPSDGAVSRYALRFKIYGTISVNEGNIHIEEVFQW